MKFLCAILVIVAANSLLFSVATYFNASGSDRLLTTMQRIRPGLTQNDVRNIMEREPQVARASEAPYWINDIVPKSETGEYWYYFMGYPARNLIIYFDESGRVGFTTWAPT